jgi:hypothetical protein
MHQKYADVLPLSEVVAYLRSLRGDVRANGTSTSAGTIREASGISASS